MPTQCPGFGYLGHRPGEFPVAEYMGLNGLHIGVHQDIGLDEMDYVLETIDAFLRRYV
jgi:dTDP-4-amino-4,6-dideoxygalactose transaminase